MADLPSSEAHRSAPPLAPGSPGRILVANRGEIARRVFRTAHAMGFETVAAYGDPDRDAPFVGEATHRIRIGPADLAESYLSRERLLDAAATTGATAVHPGYGFLSEDAAFARAVVDAGLTWIGPRPEAIEGMGSKIEARRLAVAAGVPIIPGFDDAQDEDAMLAAARDIGFPVLLKAAAGGGGKGIRIAHDESQFSAALAEASTEARRSFGDDAMIVERFVQRPRHVEVQVIGDRHGTVVNLGTRECSVQRRYQKVLEEAPAPNLSDTTRHGLRTAATALARDIGYDSAGTVEFIVDDETDDFFFLEMNTRLQVEHPVTELVTGLDLVELMIRVAHGEPLPLTQSDVTLCGHAFEARINAEDPAAGFVPQTGVVHTVTVPDGVRWDAAVEPGTAITPHYDAMIAKLIVNGADRSDALDRLRSALDRLIVGGVTTTAGLHRWLVDRDPVIDGRVTTRFLDETTIPEAPPVDASTAAALWIASRGHVAHVAGRGTRDGTTNPWTALGGFTLTPHRHRQPLGLRDGTGVVHEIPFEPDPAEPVPVGLVWSVDRTGRRVSMNVAGHTQWFDVVSRSERWRTDPAEALRASGAVIAPFPAVIAETPVGIGDRVAAGDAVIVIEAMKMLHTLKATGAGVVEAVHAAVGDQVAGGALLVTFEDDSE